MRLGVHHVTSRELCDLGRGQLHRDLAGNLFSELALQVQDVFELSIVPLGPERFVRARGNELDVQPHASADEMRGALENRLHVQLPGDLRERQRGPLVLHRGRPRDDPQGLDAREVRDHRLGHAVGEIFLRRVLRDVAKRQDGDAADRAPRRARATARWSRWRAAAATLPRPPLPKQAGAAVLLEAGRNQTVEVGGGFRPEGSHRRGRRIDDREHQRLRPVLRKRPLSCGQFEQRDAKRVDVRSRVFFLARELFGRHICQRTHDRARLGQPARHRVA